MSTLAQLSAEAADPRTRERLMALLLLAQQAPNRLCATRLSQILGRNVNTVLKWVHDFNARGPTALIYRRTGGTQAQADAFTPLLHQALQQARAAAAQPVIKNAAVAAEFASADAQEVASAPRPAALRWTLRSLCALLFCVTGISLCRETVRRALHKLGFSFKKAHKLLGKASAGHRAEFVRELAAWVRAAQQPDGPLLAFVDEAHLHLDADPGHSWAPRGQRLYVNSKSPALAQKRTCFGVYLYGAADPVQIHSTGWANSETTCDMLIALRAAYPQRPVVMVWDNVRYHHIKRCASKPSSWASAWYTCRPTVPT